MASTYTNSLRFNKQADGDGNNTWGQVLDLMLDLIDAAIAGMEIISTTGGTTTLTANNGTDDESRNAIIKVTGALTSNAIIIIPAATRLLTVWNSTSGSFTLTVKTSGGTGVTVSQGVRAQIMCDGTDCARCVTDADRPVFAATRGGAAQGIPNATPTKVLLATEDYDTHGAYDSVTNYRFQPQEAGKYPVGFGFLFSTISDQAVYYGAIYKNGTAYRLSQDVSSGTTAQGGFVFDWVPMNGSTDYVEFWVYQASGGTINLDGATTNTFASAGRGA